MNLADHRVLGNAEAAADFAGRQSLVPQGDQGVDPLGRPFVRRLHVPLPPAFRPDVASRPKSKFLAPGTDICGSYRPEMPIFARKSGWNALIITRFRLTVN